MYRHLLVPIDGTDLSTVTIGAAVDLARALGARITFFHARPDYSSSLRGEADAVRLTAPAEYTYAYEGRTRELLTKAESAARARGVPCESRYAVSDAPHSAILDAARDAKCDLIFMASHGRRSTLGMMLGSQMLKVLLHSEIPVLVSATANPPVPEMSIGIIRDEHRSIAAVLHAWLHVLKGSGEGRPDPQLIRAMLTYIQEFPLVLHHPKEENFLFSRLRERTSTVTADLDELERQHHRDHVLVAELAETVTRYEAGTASVTELEELVKKYELFIWEHMGREEGVILPAAQKYLTKADWAEINAAFSENRDPGFGDDTEGEFRRLFSRIVNLAGERTPSDK
jgi:nucleotide-binding universal stress UspA family protein/hemerythrin-like domain-containing protein